MPGPTTDEKLQCPECLQAGIVKELTNKRALGIHRRMSHGVIGASHGGNGTTTVAKRTYTKHLHAQPAVEKHKKLKVMNAEHVLKSCPRCNLDLRPFQELLNLQQEEG